MNFSDTATLKQLALQWIQGLYDEERQLALTRATHSHTGAVYKKALDSLAKYPLEITSMRDLLVVKHIGTGIVKTLEAKLDAHRRQGGVVAAGGVAAMPVPPPRAAGAYASEEYREASRGVSGSASRGAGGASRGGSSASRSASRDEPGASNSSLEPEATRPDAKRRRKTNSEYVPRFRSAAWAILIALRDANGYLSKHDIIRRAQEHADAPLDAPGVNSQYTGWSGMSTLLEKDLVAKYGHPPRFTLSEFGAELVERMLKSADAQTNYYNRDDEVEIEIVSDHIPAPMRAKSNVSNASSSNASQTSSRDQFDDNDTPLSQSSATPRDPLPVHNLTLPVGSFEIVLLLDNREIKNGANRNFFKNGLDGKNVKYESRSLDLGDVTWIARPKCEGTYHGDEEIMLEYILERKTLDDLVSSIKDGRFKEQKFRLSSCGIPNVIYLIEEVSVESANQFGYDGIHTAITQTQVENGFFVKRTTSAEDTLSYLVSMTQFLQNHYQNKSLVFDTNRKPAASSFSFNNSSNSFVVSSISFAEFAQRNSKTKNFCLGDVWIRQLLTLPGMSQEKACFFSKTFKTSAQFFKAMHRCQNDSEREKMCQDAGGEARKGVGLQLAKRLVNVFWRSEVSEMPFSASSLKE
ncbi:Crossover junction endonuclease mus81 [Podochytrium sp. JEL0797]|nr:Crossover junction endonuclease mus81 [Podochytrium sp. JEL0797]